MDAPHTQEISAAPVPVTSYCVRQRLQAINRIGRPPPGCYAASHMTFTNRRISLSQRQLRRRSLPKQVPRGGEVAARPVTGSRLEATRQAPTDASHPPWNQRFVVGVRSLCYGSASRGRRFSRPTRVGRTFTGRGRNRLQSLGAIKKSRRETAGMFRSSKTVLVICLALALAGCSSATNKQKGAVIGGTTGAVIGGVVGKQAGNT